MTQERTRTRTAELTDRLDELTAKREQILLGDAEGDLTVVGAEIKKVTTALAERGSSA